MPRHSIRPWNRPLWGVLFIGRHGGPTLIGSGWLRPMRGAAYDGEPTRTLLFTSRAAARAWCASKMAAWQDGRDANDPVMKWRVRPVRVRETVRVI